VGPGVTAVKGTDSDASVEHRHPRVDILSTGRPSEDDKSQEGDSSDQDQKFDQSESTIMRHVVGLLEE
jgi:hypothetical protein